MLPWLLCLALLAAVIALWVKTRLLRRAFDEIAEGLARVLGNILNNALKYSAGDLEIVLTEDGEVRFTNTAPGLDEVAVGWLFDRFFTVEAAHGSTGLGLAIAKALVEQMGGAIGAEYSGGRLTVWVNFHS